MGERLYARLLAAGVLGVAALKAAAASSGGDYPTDAGPALAAVAHGSWYGFFAHQPAMGPVAMYLRVPFVATAAALGDGGNGIYRWGCLACLLVLAAVTWWLAQVARRRGSGRIGMALLAAVCLLNPLVGDALYWGHPEEILTAALLLGALLAALEQRPMPAAVLLAAAVGSKQWALLGVLPAILILERQRLRTLCWAGGLTAAAWVPLVAVNPDAFRRGVDYISHPQPVVTVFTWLYPFSNTGPVTVANIFGDSRTFQGRQLGHLGALAARPAIMVIGLLLPLVVVWRTQGTQGAHRILAAAAVALLLRCALDPGCAAYYHLPLLLVLVVWDVAAGRRVPVAGMIAYALSFVVLDRAAGYLSAPLVNGLYVAASAIALAVLACCLRPVAGQFGALRLARAGVRAA